MAVFNRWYRRLNFRNAHDVDLSSGGLFLSIDVVHRWTCSHPYAIAKCNKMMTIQAIKLHFARRNSLVWADRMRAGQSKPLRMPRRDKHVKWGCLKVTRLMTLRGSFVYFSLAASMWARRYSLYPFHRRCECTVCHVLLFVRCTKPKKLSLSCKTEHAGAHAGAIQPCFSRLAHDRQRIDAGVSTFSRNRSNVQSMRSLAQF